MGIGTVHQRTSYSQPGRIADYRRGFLYVIVGCLAVSIVSILGLNQEFKFSVLSSVLFLVVTFFLSLTAVIRRSSVLDNPIYLAVYSYVIFVGIGPLVARTIEPFSLFPKVLNDVGGWPLLMSWLGFACLGLGYFLGKYALRNRKRVGPDGGWDQHRDPTYLLYGGIGYTVAGLIGVLSYLLSVGGLAYLLGTPYGIRENPSFYAGLYNMLRPGLFLVAAFLIGRNKRSFWSSVGLLLYLAFDLLWFGPLRGSRQQIITLILSLGYIAKYCAPLGSRGFLVLTWRRWLMAVGMLIALFWGALRIYSIEDLLARGTPDLNVATDTGNATALALYQPFDSFARIVELVPASVPYQWGSTFYESSTVFVPRDLWRSKPHSVAEWLSDTLYRPGLGGNSAPTWPGELYLDFGVAGIVLGMIAMGMACAWMVSKSPSDSDSPRSIFRGLLTAVWFPLPFEWVWGGSNPAVWHFLFNVLPICIVIGIMRLRPRRVSCSV